MYQFLLKNFCSKCKTIVLKGKSRNSQEIRLMSTDILQENLEVLKKLGYEDPKEGCEYKKILKPYKKPRRLKVVVDLLQDLGFSATDIKNDINILRVTPSIIENRARVLKEGGLRPENITISILTSFFKFTSRSIEDLKVNGWINKDLIVSKNILSHSDFPPHLYPVEEDQSLSFDQLQVSTVHTYLAWKCDMSREMVEKKCRIIDKPIRSIALMLKSYNFVRETLGLTTEQVQKNIYLLFHHPDEYLRTLEKVPLIGKVPLLTIAKINPKILMRPGDQLIDKIEAIKELGLSLQIVQVYSDILLLSKETIKKRLQILQNDPNFQLHLHTPGIIKAILYFNKIQRRYKILNEINWRCQTLEMLSTRTKVFQSRLKKGNDMSMGDDIVRCLHRELKISRQKLRAALKQNPVWNLVPLTVVIGNLQVLRERSFTDSQIGSAITVLLYPSVDVLKCLDELDTNTEVDCCRDLQTNKLKDELILQLVLYYLERPYHFNGNGIFTNQPPVNHDLVASFNFDTLSKI